MATNERWIVKQVISGDSLILRTKIEIKGTQALVQEKYVIIANIIAPKLLKKPPISSNDIQRDEPFAWNSREYLKTLIQSKCVVYKSINSSSKDKENKKDYGSIFLEKANTLIDVAELMISSGFCEVKPTKGTKLDLKHFLDLQKEAQSKYLGKWVVAKEQNTPSHMIRQVKFDFVIDSTHTSEFEKFYQKNKSKEIPILIENVRDGSNFRAFLLSEMKKGNQNGYGSDFKVNCSNLGAFYSVNVSLTGIKTPSSKLNSAEKQTNEEDYFKEAQFFSESKLLQADKLLCRIEGILGRKFLISLIHSRGNIALFLLNDGLAQCNESTIQKLTSSNIESYRSSEKNAKQKKLRIWKDSVSNSFDNYSNTEDLEVLVIEICPNLSINVITKDLLEKKIFLSNFIIPKKFIQNDVKNENSLSMEIREFLRIMLINKKVLVHTDYVKDGRSYATIKLLPNLNNVSCEIIKNGLGIVLKTKSDEKSCEYDQMVFLEIEAIEKKIGIHSDSFQLKKLRLVDVSSDVTKAKQYKSFLDRAGIMQGIIDYVYGSSKFKIRIPKESCIISFVLAGISCPKYSSTTKTSEPFSAEVFAFVKRLLTQQEVEIQVLSIDKNGNYVGWMYLKHKIPSYLDQISKSNNVSFILLENGLAKVHQLSDKLSLYSKLLEFQDKAKKKNLNMWSVAELKTDNCSKTLASEVNVKASISIENNLLIVTSINGDNCLKIWAQDTKLAENFMKINNEIKNQELLGFVPSKLQMEIGTLCCVKFSDKKWYRAKIEKFESHGYCLVRLVDYGNIFTVLQDDLFQLPESCYQEPFVAQTYHLSFIEFPRNVQDFADEVRYIFKRRLMSIPSKAKIFISNKCSTIFCSFICNKPDLSHSNILNDKVKLESIDFDDETSIDQLWTLCQIDISMELLGKGWCTISNEIKHFDNNLINIYQIVQNTAKKRRLGLWKFGEPYAVDSD